MHGVTLGCAWDDALHFGFSCTCVNYRLTFPELVFCKRFNLWDLCLVTLDVLINQTMYFPNDILGRSIYPCYGAMTVTHPQAFHSAASQVNWGCDRLASELRL